VVPLQGRSAAFLARIANYRFCGTNARYDLDIGRFWIPDNSRKIADIDGGAKITRIPGNVNEDGSLFSVSCLLF
jgi:hypothetical protein